MTTYYWVGNDGATWDDYTNWLDNYNPDIGISSNDSSTFPCSNETNSDIVDFIAILRNVYTCR